MNFWICFNDSEFILLISSYICLLSKVQIHLLSTAHSHHWHDVLQTTLLNSQPGMVGGCWGWMLNIDSFKRIIKWDDSIPTSLDAHKLPALCCLHMYTSRWGRHAIAFSANNVDSSMTVNHCARSATAIFLLRVNSLPFPRWLIWAEQ